MSRAEARIIWQSVRSQAAVGKNFLISKLCVITRPTRPAWGRRRREAYRSVVSFGRSMRAGDTFVRPCSKGKLGLSIGL